ncbi:TetR/AcrR family transcriptional regulator (plasmid) [Paraburkholderia graminis]|uniref:TetR/AcrR family transcriptional regulator n=1 Tax=Paraburkholderia graminis TaxID=60548 RepID=UPI000DEFFAC8|nr:TetR/AcrR family transcriptional regulator [Paraburkholderia graminis]AXF12575.1 TetR/AcrR family transcriptional regulator [Paraburkholderia graminis]
MAAGTRDALVRAAENLMRTRGYAAFSYADLVGTVGIRKASIHHHFPTKEDLGIAIVEAYVARVVEAFERIERENSGLWGRLNGFFETFRASSDGTLLPLCGALAAEMTALPPELQKLTHRFFDLQLRWLAKVIDKGIADGEIPAGAGSRQKAYQVLSVLEGASFVDWAMKEGESLDSSIIRLIVAAS